MSFWSRALVVLAMTAALIPVGVHPAWGCKCVPPAPDAEAAQHSAAVFTGVSEGEVGGGLTQTVSWKFRVDDVYKGSVHETETIGSATQSTACGITFDEGQRYVVFAFGDPDQLSTNTCSNTRPWPEGRPLALGDLEPHAPLSGGGGGESGGSFVVLAIGAALVIAVGFTISRMRRASRPEEPPE